MTDIYMISRETHGVDRDNYSNGTSTTDEDYGYFTDRADAQAKIDELNAPVVAEYAVYTEGIGRFNRARQTRVQAEARDHAALVNAGLREPRATEREASVEATRDYQNWVFETEHTTYEIVVVEPGEKPAATA